MMPVALVVTLLLVVLFPLAGPFFLLALWLLYALYGVGNGPNQPRTGRVE